MMMDGRHVIRCHNGGRRYGKLHQSSGTVSPVFNVPSTGCKQLRSNRLSPLLVRLQETGNTGAYAVESDRRHDHPDPFVAEIEEVQSGFHKTFFVVDHDLHYFRNGTVGSEYNDRDTLSRQILQSFAPSRVLVSGAGNQAHDAVATQNVNVVDLLLGILVTIAEEKGISAGLRFVLNTSHQLRIERVGYTGNDHTDRKTPLSPQAPSQKVRMIIKASNDLPNSRTSLFRNA
jgi:hypothetical protein